jgi:hypothetical protein
VTANERRLLTALVALRGNATPAELIERYPELYAGDVRSVTASIHLTAASAARKGYVTRGRRMVRSENTGQVHGGSRLYRITAAGRAALGGAS